VDLIFAGVMAAVVNWTRAPKSWPLWLSYAIVVPIGAAIYFVLNRDWIPALRADWRIGLEPFVLWLAAGFGFGRAAKETPMLNVIMPKTDSK
jgi:hypothetical protein